jgi:hypothetical protein
MCKWIASVLMITTVFSAAGQTHEQSTHHRFAVRIAVTMSDEYADLMRSSLARELRRLDSVEVSNEKNANHTLHVVGVTTAAGGLAVAVTLESRVVVTPVMYFSLDQKCYPTENQKHEVSEAYRDAVVVDYLWVFTDHDVQSLAARIVAAVDANAIEHHRETEKQLDLLRKRAAEQKPEQQ